MRLMYYFAICILVRLLLAYLVYKLLYRRILSLVCMMIGVGFIYQYIVKTRTTGAFHNKVWWDHSRPIHALLFLFASFGLFYQYPYSYMFLLLDTLIGLLGFIHKNSNQYNN